MRRKNTKEGLTLEEEGNKKELSSEENGAGGAFRQTIGHGTATQREQEKRRSHENNKLLIHLTGEW